MNLMHTVSSYAKTDECNAMEAAILKLLKARKPGASICPSEAARALFGTGWREQMPQIRAVVNEMAKQSRIEICQKGFVVDPVTVKGPICLRILGN
jgi:hypothetical protein